MTWCTKVFTALGTRVCFSQSPFFYIKVKILNFSSRQDKWQLLGIKDMPCRKGTMNGGIGEFRGLSLQPRSHELFLLVIMKRMHQLALCIFIHTNITSQRVALAAVLTIQTTNWTQSQQTNNYCYSCDHSALLPEIPIGEPARYPHYRPKGFFHEGTHQIYKIIHLLPPNI